MSNQFLEIDRSEPITLPGGMAGRLEKNDLARFIVEVMEALGVLKLEDVSLDGAKILANASQHHTMS